MQTNDSYLQEQLRVGGGVTHPCTRQLPTQRLQQTSYLDKR